MGREGWVGRDWKGGMGWLGMGWAWWEGIHWKGGMGWDKKKGMEMEGWEGRD